MGERMDRGGEVKGEECVGKTWGYWKLSLCGKRKEIMDV